MMCPACASFVRVALEKELTMAKERIRARSIANGGPDFSSAGLMADQEMYSIEHLMKLLLGSEKP